MPSLNLLSEAVLRRARPLPAAFYQRDAAVVAPELLGKILVHEVDGILLAGRIVEVEAYLGAQDPASHAFRGETKRNRAMFDAGGACYVYLSYGMHLCMNVVTAAAGIAQGCLLRALEPLLHPDEMARRRGVAWPGSPRAAHALTSGPGKLTQAMGITLLHNGRRFFSDDFKIVAPRPAFSATISTTPRIGISKAADLPWRFIVAGSPYVSRR